MMVNVKKNFNALNTDCSNYINMNFTDNKKIFRCIAKGIIPRNISVLSA